MFILKKIFQLRDKTQSNEEDKPFLEHLEDLRNVVFKVALTLFIATLACFAFKNQLMDVIRRPIEQVWTKGQQAKMPKKAPVVIDLKTWELAKKAAYDTSSFTQEQKDFYFSHIDPDDEKKLKFHSETIGYYRAAIDIEKVDKSGEDFIQKIPGISDTMRSQLLTLIDEEMRPDATVDAEGKVVRMQSLTPTEGFMLSMKLAFFAGIVISFPFLLYFLMQFILPGLKPNEKKALWPAMAIGFGLFLVGVLFSYFFVLPKVLDFFYNYSAGMGVENEWRIGYYITFATQFTLIFGLGFELPVVVMTLVKLGIMNYEMMKNTRSYAILAIIIIAAVITPTPDVFTLGLLAGPMIVLYEICIWLAYFDNKRKAKLEADEEAESRERRLKYLASTPLSVSRDEEDEDHEQEEDFDPHYDADEDYHALHPDGEGEGDESDDGEHDFDERELEAKKKLKETPFQYDYNYECEDLHDGAYRHDPHMEGEYDPDDYRESIEQNDTSADDHS